MNVLEGKIMRVDLSTRSIQFEDYAPYSEWLGGQGVNQFILFNELPLGISSYDPSNIIAVGTGSLVGTDTPGASRTNIDTLNPLTGGIGSANAGGDFARDLRFAGIHNIIVKGRSENLVYLRIDDQSAEILDASHLKSKTISEATTILNDELGKDYKLLLIGPAGENLARIACIMLDEARSAGRCGIGAVMGSKNLKAIAVRGTGRIQVSNPQEFKKLAKEARKKLVSHPFPKGMMSGGVYSRETFVMGIESPYRNYSGMVVDADRKKRIAPEAFQHFMVGSKTCGTCPVHCWKVYEVIEEGQRVTSQALQINSIHNFAAKLDLFDPEIVLRAHRLCDELGLDEDSTCGVIAWACECFEKGLISNKDTEGLDLSWGNAEVIFQLIKDIAYRKGFGDILAEGCKRASESFPGTEECCIHVKGQDLMETIWISPSWALGTVVAARGGTHTRGAALSNRLEDLPEEVCQRLFGIGSVGEITSYENKEQVVAFFEKFDALSNSLGLCYFVHGLALVDLLLPEDYARLYSAATGEDMTAERIMWLGERIFNLEKCFNVLHTNWGRADDMPPERFISQPLDNRFKIDPKAWNEMLSRYYKIHGWDQLTGRPLPETLDRLELNVAKKKLAQNGKLA
jgi:aldehyde:ferredoxin oxidoreductase